MTIYRIQNYIDSDKRTVIKRSAIDGDDIECFGQIDVDLSKLGVAQPVPIQFPLKTDDLKQAFEKFDAAAKQAAEDTFAEYEAFKAAVAKRAELAAADKAASKILGPAG
jgi:hypothetical protein